MKLLRCCYGEEPCFINADQISCISVMHDEEKGWYVQIEVREQIWVRLEDYYSTRKEAIEVMEEFVRFVDKV